MTDPAVISKRSEKSKPTILSIAPIMSIQSDSKAVFSNTPEPWLSFKN
jgi:hypothetical protein